MNRRQLPSPGWIDPGRCGSCCPGKWSRLSSWLQPRWIVCRWSCAIWWWLGGFNSSFLGPEVLCAQSIFIEPRLVSRPNSSIILVSKNLTVWIPSVPFLRPSSRILSLRILFSLSSARSARIITFCLSSAILFSRMVHNQNAVFGLSNTLRIVFYTAT